MDLYSDGRAAMGEQLRGGARNCRATEGKLQRMQAPFYSTALFSTHQAYLQRSESTGHGYRRRQFSLSLGQKFGSED